MNTILSYNDDLSEVFLGRKIVSVEYAAKLPKSHDYWENLDGTDPVGLLTLDDGTKIYARGNDGGCACSSGCYYLSHLEGTDNIITSVEVVDESSNEDYYREDGSWKIFVLAGDKRINVATFEGDDGNGYYGTGFYLKVVKA